MVLNWVVNIYKSKMNKMKSCLLVGIFAILCLLISCSSSKKEIIDEILLNHIITGENIVDCKSFWGRAEESAINKKTGVHVVRNQLEYVKFWDLQNVVRKSADVIDFDERFCVLVILEPWDYTQISFYKIIKGIDGDFHAYFIVDRQPLQTEKKLLSFCVLNAPIIKGNAKIELIYLKENPHLGYTVKPAEIIDSLVIE